MIMMMTDQDRVALSAFLPAFLFRFIHPFMPTSTPTFHRNVPPLQFVTSYYPVRSSFTSQQICSFSSHFSSTFWHACQTPHYFSRLLPLVCAAPLSRSSFISTSFAPKQPTTTQKNLQSRVTSRPPPLILCKPARTRTCVRLSMYLLPVAVFISHQKEGFVKEERHRSTKKRRS